MAQFIKVTEASGRDYHINVDCIAAFTEGSEPGSSLISLREPVILEGTPVHTLQAKIDVGMLAIRARE